MDFDAEGPTRKKQPPWQRYATRPDDLDDETLFRSIAMYGDRSRAPMPRPLQHRLLSYFPCYPVDPTDDRHSFFCCMKVLLHHTFRDLPQWNQQTPYFFPESDDSFTSWVATCKWCAENHHHHPHDYMDDPLPPLDDDKFEEGFQEAEGGEVHFG